LVARRNGFKRGRVRCKQLISSDLCSFLAHLACDQVLLNAKQRSSVQLDVLMPTLAAVVVTRNRPGLLERCLAAIYAQSYPIAYVVVVDNASDQATRDLLVIEAARKGPGFHAIRLEENTGGAGGFHYGMKACLQLPCTHMWLMDDDCEPDADAVKELLATTPIVGEDVVLGSNVFDLDGEICNVQPVAIRAGSNRLPQYSLHLADGVIEVISLTFVSFLVPRQLVRKAGLPLKEIFIWGDDLEYSMRLARYAKLYQVGKSKATHLKRGNASLSVARESDYKKIRQYRFFYRNKIYVISKYDGVISPVMVQLIFRSIKDVYFSIRSGEFVLIKCRTVLYGLLSGVVFSLRMARMDCAQLPATEGLS
jgi:GT2 family glycosyltransferase